MRWLLAFLIGCGTAPSTPTAPMAAHTAIDAIIEAALRDGEAVGVSIAIQHGDRIVTRGYGLADVEHRTPATEHTVYPLASLSKQFWGVGVVRKLASNPALSIESPVKAALPRFPDEHVRIRDLMQQTSGLGDDRDDEDDVTFKDVHEMAFTPGSWWHYSNRAAILVRVLADQLAGTDFLQTQIAGPLGLHSIHVCGDHAPLYEHGKPTGLPESTMQRVRFVCADAPDVMRFEQALDRGTLLDPATVAAMRTPVEIPSVGQIGYGLLTRIVKLDGHRAYGHTGDFDGVSVAAFRFPADDLTIVVLMNARPKRGYRAPTLVEQIAKLELGLVESAPGSPPAETLAAIAGTYDVGGIRGQITVRDGAAYLEVAGWSGPLVWLGGRRFRGGPEDEELQFLPATGEVHAAALGSRFLLDSLAHRVDN